MRVFPWKLVIVLNSVILWTLIGGLLEEYIFIGIAGCFFTIFLSLCILERMKTNGEQGENMPCQDKSKKIILKMKMS